MQVSVDELWKLLAASELPSAARVASLRAEFEAQTASDAEPASVRRLLHWLVSGGQLTRYQAAVLAAGRPGPFVFGSFVISGRIDAGRLRGMYQATYKGRQQVLLAPQPKSDTDESDEWIRLAELSAAVRHPHVARVYRVVRHKAQSFAVLEPLAGQSLAERLSAGPLQADQAQAIARQLGLALQAIGQANQAHGAVTSENIWLDTAGDVRLLPFPLVSLAARQQATPAGDQHDLDRTLQELIPQGTVPDQLHEHVAGVAPAPAAAHQPELATKQPVAVAIPLPEVEATPAAALAAPAPLVRIEPRESAVIMPRRKSRARSMYVALAAGALLFGVVGYLVYQRQSGTTPNPPAAATALAPDQPIENEPATANSSPPTSPDDSQNPTPPTPDNPSQVTAIDDDGRTLWISPTIGAPLELKYLPGGAQLIFALRPAELLATAEGSKLFDALGPGGTWARESLQTMLGVPLVEIEALTLAFVPDESLVPRPVAVMRLAKREPAETLLKAWQNPRPAKLAEQEYFVGTTQAYYLPAAEAGRVAVIAPEAMIKEIIELGGQPNLRKGIERLVRHSDHTRQFTLLFTPSFLLSDGRDLLAGGLQKLRPTVAEFFDQQIEAVLLSAHVGEELFVEFRAIPPSGQRAEVLAEELRTRWAAAPEQVESHLAGLSIHPHGRLVVNRLPRMLQLARDYTRTGSDDEQVVLNCYLPAAATHNFLLSSELLLAGLTESTAAPPAGAPTPTPKSAADLLQRKISLSFPRESLDRCLEVLSKELGLEIVILGPDLQLEGITKNQSLNNVDERDQPAEAILRKILLLANPDGKLVYVIRPGTGPSATESLWITTREAAKKRGEGLPPGF